jgi:hypothetical protein
MFVCYECCVFSGRGLCDGLTTRPGDSYRLWRVVVCDKETSINDEAKARYRAVKNTTTVGCNARKTNKHIYIYIYIVGRDSAVGIAIRYGTDGPGIESRWGLDFSHPSRPALLPTQPPIQ